MGKFTSIIKIYKDTYLNSENMASPIVFRSISLALFINVELKSVFVIDGTLLKEKLLLYFGRNSINRFRGISREY